MVRDRSRFRVAFDNSLARGNLFGTGIYASQLIQKLSADPSIDFRVLDGPKLSMGGHSLAARGLKTIALSSWTRWVLPKLLRQGQFNVFHAPNFIVPKNTPCPSVVTVHDLSFLLFPQHFRGRWAARVESQMPRALQSASGVICVSQQTRNDLLRFYKISPSKVHVVYNGIHHARFHPAARLDPEWAHRAGLRSGYILHVGSLAARKNIPSLLRAVADLRSRGKWGNRQVVLAGSETRGLPGAREVHETIAQLGLTNTVLLPGHVPNEQVPGLYAEAALLVMPTLYEGFGLPVLEAMASGTPVVASNNSSIPEVAGDAAMLVPTSDDHALAEAIEGVLNSSDITAKMRAAGLVQAKKFSWQRAADETAAVYRGVAG